MTRPASKAEPPTLAYLAIVNRVTGVWCQCEKCWHNATLAPVGRVSGEGSE